jgi:thioredoxin-dependent peroxiredoxin
MRTLVTLFFALSMPMVWAAPEVGDVAPDFDLQSSDGERYQLSQFKGERGVVIAFFPRVFTGG